jgi:hypothetical protein
MKIRRLGAKSSRHTPVVMFRAFIVTALKLTDKVINHHAESDGDKIQ